MDTSPDFDPGLDPRSAAAALENGFAHLDSGQRRDLATELLDLGDRVTPVAAVTVGFVAAVPGDGEPDDGTVALADRIAALLPDDASLRDAADAADGDVAPLLAVLESYDDTSYERLRELVVRGSIDGSDDPSLAAVTEAFGVDSVETALAGVRDIAWLVSAADLHDAAREAFVAAAGLDEPPSGWTDHRQQVARAGRAWEGVADDLESALYGGVDEQGFVQLNPLYFSRASPPDPETCWRTGFDLKAVKEGYAYERTAVTGELLESLRSGENRLVVGRAGSGKSTICKSVACRWYETASGPVVYRSSWAEADFDDAAALLEHLREMSGHVLVVIEDAIRYPNQEAFEVIDTVTDADDVSATFLLEARRGELDGLGGQLGDEQDDLAATVQRLRGPVLVDFEVPGLDDEECVAMVDHFEAITGTTVVESTDALLERTRRNQGVGGDDVIHFAYHLVRSTEGFETGLEKNVEAVYDRLRNPDEALVPHGELAAQVGLAVNVLKAANVPVHRELLYTLADEYEAVETVIDELTGELLFESSDSAALKTNHELWASLYVRMVLEKEDAETAHRKFAACVNTIFSIFDPGTRQEIERWMGRADAEVSAPTDAAGGTIGTGSGDRAYLSAVLPAAKVVDKIADLGRRWPVLAPLYGTAAESKLELPSVCSTMTVADFIAARGDMYLNSGEPDLAMAEYRTAQELVEESDSINERLTRKMEAVYYNNVGDVALNRGDLEEARSYYTRALEISRDIRYRIGEAKSLTNLGSVNWSLDEHEHAVEHYEQALEIYREIGDHHEGARCLKNLGLVAWGRGDYEEADRFLDRSLEIYREIGDRLGEASCLNNRGLVAQEYGTLEKAEEWYQRSLEIYREIGDRYGESIALSNIGMVALMRGNADEAEGYHTHSLEISRDVDDQVGEATCFENLGRVAFERGNFEKAERLFGRSIELCEEIGNLAVQGDALRFLGVIARERGEVGEAVAYHEDALERFRELDRPTKQARCLHDLGKNARAREDHHEALEYFEQACELFLDVGSGRHGVEVLADLLSICERLDEDEKHAEWCTRGRDFAESVGQTEALAPYCGD
jgi:tetratricopeptide (TPR) repeat protein/energy-coupling factor transporter ATP-binding protein EcfA2